jgi:hypothetical protein
VTVLNAGKVTTQQTRPALDIALRETSLAPVTANHFSNIYFRLFFWHAAPHIPARLVGYLTQWENCAQEISSFESTIAASLIRDICLNSKLRRRRPSNGASRTEKQIAPAYPNRRRFWRTDSDISHRSVRANGQQHANLRPLIRDALLAEIDRFNRPAVGIH